MTNLQKPGTEKLKVCTVSSLPSPLVNARARVMLSAGHQVSLVYPKSESGSDGLQVYNPRANAHGPLRIAREFCEFRKTLRNLSPDIIHVHFAGGPYAALACILGRCPVVVSVMGGDVLADEQPHPTYASRKLSLAIVDAADAITAKSEFLLRRLGEMGLGRRHDDAFRVLWGLDFEKFRPGIDASALRASLGIEAGAKIVFCPRSIEPLYNIDVVIKAFVEVVADFPNAYLLLSGVSNAAEYREQMKQLAESNGLGEKVRWLDVIDPELMPQYYNLTDVMVGIPSSDGLPQSLLEAIACGTACVVTNLERYCEVVDDGVHVLMSDPRDAGAVATKINVLLANEPERRKLAANGLRRAHEMLDSKKDAARVGNLYFELMNRKRRNSGVAKRLKVALFLALHFIETGLYKVAGK